MNIFLQLLYLFIGQIIHFFTKAYELDKANEDEDIAVLDVIWNGPEKWRTLSMCVLMTVLALSNSVEPALTAVGITADSTGLTVLLLAAGYNLDSISNKIFALTKTK